MFFDFDGDGEAELLLPTLDSEHATSGQRHLTVWTFKKGKVDLYPPCAKLPAVGVEDADGDGRPDLILDLLDTYQGMDTGYPTHSSIHSDQWKLAHSLKDGSFSTTDKVATSYKPSAD